MKLASHFIWNYDAPVVSWNCEGSEIIKRYHKPIRSAVLLSDSSGVAIVEPFADAGRNNAVIFNSDGSERFRLKFPLSEPHGYCFDQMYYIQGRLNAFANLDGADFRYELNENTGDILASFEAR